MSDEFVITATTNQDVDAPRAARPESLDEALGQTGDGLMGAIEEHLGAAGEPADGAGAGVPSGTPGVPANVATTPAGPSHYDPPTTPVGNEALGAGQAPPVSTLGLTELAPHSAGPGSMRDLRLLADISVQVTVEFGRARLPLRQLLSLTRGAVLELHRTPEQPVDVLVNDTLIARGEVVLVGDEFGVRITEIVNPNHPNHGLAGIADNAPAGTPDTEPAAATDTASPATADAAPTDAAPTDGADDGWGGGAISATTTAGEQ